MTNYRRFAPVLAAILVSIPIDQVSEIEAVGTHDIGSGALLIGVLLLGLTLGIGAAVGS